MTDFNIETATLQEAADYVVQQIVKQGGQSMGDSHSSCAYGNTKGQHCAIGWLLDDTNLPMMTLEGTVDDLIGRYEEFVPNIVKDNTDFFDLLQSFHDEDWINVRTRILKDIGVKYDIDTSADHWTDWVEMGKS